MKQRQEEIALNVGRFEPTGGRIARERLHLRECFNIARQIDIFDMITGHGM